MTQVITPVEEYLAVAVARIETELEAVVAAKGLPSIVDSGTVTTQSGIFTAYVSCLPKGNVSEEAIEVTFDLTPLATGLHFVAAIVWSDGTPIAELDERDLPAHMSHTGMTAFRMVCNAFAERATTELKARIVQTQ